MTDWTERARELFAEAWKDDAYYGGAWKRVGPNTAGAAVKLGREMADARAREIARALRERVADLHATSEASTWQAAYIDGLHSAARQAEETVGLAAPPSPALRQFAVELDDEWNAAIDAAASALAQLSYTQNAQDRILALKRPPPRPPSKVERIMKEVEGYEAHYRFGQPSPYATLIERCRAIAQEKDGDG